MYGWYHNLWLERKKEPRFLSWTLRTHEGHPYLLISDHTEVCEGAGDRLKRVNPQSFRD